MPVSAIPSHLQKEKGEKKSSEQIVKHSGVEIWQAIPFQITLSTTIMAFHLVQCSGAER